MSYIYSLILFAVACSITPGPNNIMVMSSGVNYGVMRSLPLLLGICIGFAAMLAIVGAGLSKVFNLIPEIHQVIKVVGVIYLLYLAWVISRAGNVSKTRAQSKPLSFMNGALFQWVNAKAWVVATGAIAAFTSSQGDFDIQILIVVAIFLLVLILCLGIWLAFGTILSKYLDDKFRRKWFNFTMAGLLVLSVVPVIQQLIEEFGGL